jgi:acyl carrier protein
MDRRTVTMGLAAASLALTNVSFAAPGCIERVKKILVTLYRVDPKLVTPTARFDDLGLDSIDMAAFWIGIEAEFIVEIDMKTCNEFTTVGNLVTYLEKNANGTRGCPVSR